MPRGVPRSRERWARTDTGSDRVARPTPWRSSHVPSHRPSSASRRRSQTLTSHGAPGDSDGGTGAHRVLPNGDHPLLPHDPHIAMAVTAAFEAQKDVAYSTDADDYQPTTA